MARGQIRADYARDFWVAVTAPPKCLPDVLEAYIGAVFVDSGYDYSRVLDFFRTHAQPYFEDMAIYDTFANKHPVALASSLLAQKFGCRDWRVAVRETAATAADNNNDNNNNSGDGAAAAAAAADATIGPDGSDAADLLLGTQVAAGFLVHGRVVAHGTAASGRYAKVAAAKMALRTLEALAVDAFRRQMGCDCAERERERERAGGAGEATAAAGGRECEEVDVRGTAV
jgi:endoribonuclease Dicer